MPDLVLNSALPLHWFHEMFFVSSLHKHHLYFSVSSSYTWQTPVQTSRCDHRKSSPGQSSGSSTDFSQVFQFPAKSPEAPVVIRIWGSQEAAAQTSCESWDKFCDDTETRQAGWDLCHPSDPPDQAWRCFGVFQRRSGQFHSKSGNSDSTTAAC